MALARQLPAINDGNSKAGWLHFENDRTGVFDRSHETAPPAL